MNDKQMIPGTEEAWDTGQLGADEKYVRVASPETHQQVDEALGLQMISIRLPKGLIDTYKTLASFHEIGYQPLMRDALTRFANNELKCIVSGFVQSQQKSQKQEATEKRVADAQKKAA